MAAPAPFYSGIHCRYLFMLDGSQVVLDVEKWSAKRRITKAEDGVQGEIRNRVVAYTDGYDLSITAKLSDSLPLEKLLLDQDNEDATSIPLVKSCACVVLPPNQRKAAYNATEVTVLDWEWAHGGRTERGMITIPLNARFFKKVRTF